MSLQGYLAWGNALTSFVEKSGLNSLTKRRAQFVVSLLTDALSPANTLRGNLAALKRMIGSGGPNLLEGVQNLLPDRTANQGTPAQVDKIAFELRNDLALSPGIAGAYRISSSTLLRNTIAPVVNDGANTARIAHG